MPSCYSSEQAIIWENVDFYFVAIELHTESSALELNIPAFPFPAQSQELWLLHKGLPSRKVIGKQIGEEDDLESRRQVDLWRY